jgi:hypothetical protein
MRQYRSYRHQLCAVVAVGLLCVLVACTPIIQPPAADAPQADAGQAESPAVQAARQALAQALQVDATTITVTSEEAMEWPDACLGAATVDEMCAQVVTPGYLITLSANGNAHLYHTNEDGSMVRSATEQGEMGAAPVDGETTFFVESVEVRILESDPVQVEAVVRGQLADACTTMTDATVEVQDKTFVVTLQTTRPADQMCAQVLTPFEQVVPLGTPDPATGAYDVQVGDVVQSFTLGE